LINPNYQKIQKYNASEVYNVGLQRDLSFKINAIYKGRRVRPIYNIDSDVF
jgi:hypothetical protein